MQFAALIQPLIEKRPLQREEACDLMRFLMSGTATEAQIGAVLLAIRVKGTTPTELAAYAEVMREHAATIKHCYNDLVDTCGTGGGCASFNISTAAAILASAAGVRIAKHGNRAITSKCGSADVLEALGIDFHAEQERLVHLLETVGIIFMFAPAHHQAMKHVGPARRQLEVRTIFNQLGPLANPAGAKRQLIGVYDQAMVRPMADALMTLGAERALVVHGDDDLDEISPVTGTSYALLDNGEVWEGRFSPEDFGARPIDPSALVPGENPAENAAILTEAITNPTSPRFAAILPSAAAAIYLSGMAESLSDAAEIARATCGAKAAEKLEELVTTSRMQ